MPVEVTVPEGIYCGDMFTVDYCGGAYDIMCPDGCGPGMAIVVDLPAGPPPEQPAETVTTPVEVVVPDGVFGGDYFTVDFDGQAYDITCPEGCGPGAPIIVDLPVGPAEQQPPPEPPPSSLKEKENDLPPGYEKIGKKGKGLALSLNIGGGLKLSLALATVRIPIKEKHNMFRPSLHLMFLVVPDCSNVRPIPLVRPRSKASSKSASRSRYCDPMVRGACPTSKSTTGGPATTLSCCRTPG